MEGKELRTFNQEHETNKNVRTVIHYIGIIAVVLILGVVYAVITGTPPDAGLYGLAGTTVGYLGGLFKNANAPVSERRSGDSVTVENTADNPIPTEAVEDKNGE